MPKTFGERMDINRSRGMCSRCGRERDRQDRIMCADCREKKRIYGLQQRESERDEKQMASTPITRHRELMERGASLITREATRERRRRGICTRCGYRNASEEFVTCEYCRKTALRTKHRQIGYGGFTNRRPKPIPTERTCVRCHADHPDMDELLCVGCRDLIEPTEGCAHRWNVGNPVFFDEDEMMCEITYGECSVCGGQRTWSLKEDYKWNKYMGDEDE